MSKMKKRIAIVFVWLLLWQGLCLYIHNDILLAGPLETATTLFHMLREAETYTSLSFSMIRIVGGFVCGSLLGMVLAWMAYRRSLLADFLAPLITTLKAVPVASFVIMLLIWAGNRNLSFLISLLVVFPFLYINTLEGLRTTDTKLIEMAAVFHIPPLNQLRYIYFPHLYGYLYSAFQIALGMCWKSGIAAEVIGQPLLSIGNGLYRAKIYLETGELFAWTILVIFCSKSIEYLFLFLFRKVAGK